MQETSRSRQEYVLLMVGYFLFAGFRLEINIMTQELLRGARHHAMSTYALWYHRL